MKQKDIGIIVAVVIISALFSTVVSNLIFSSSHKQLTVESAQSISPAFATPDPRYFNTQSVNPTRIITIGNNSNPDPFSAGQ